MAGKPCGHQLLLPRRDNGSVPTNLSDPSHPSMQTLQSSSQQAPLHQTHPPLLLGQSTNSGMVSLTPEDDDLIAFPALPPFAANSSDSSGSTDTASDVDDRSDDSGVQDRSDQGPGLSNNSNLRSPMEPSGPRGIPNPTTNSVSDLMFFRTSNSAANAEDGQTIANNYYSSHSRVPSSYEEYCRNSTAPIPQSNEPRPPLPSLQGLSNDAPNDSGVGGKSVPNISDNQMSHGPDPSNTPNVTQRSSPLDARPRLPPVATVRGGPLFPATQFANSRKNFAGDGGPKAMKRRRVDSITSAAAARPGENLELDEASDRLTLKSAEPFPITATHPVIITSTDDLIRLSGDMCSPPGLRFSAFLTSGPVDFASHSSQSTNNLRSCCKCGGASPASVLTNMCLARCQHCDDVLSAATPSGAGHFCVKKELSENTPSAAPSEDDAEEKQSKNTENVSKDTHSKPEDAQTGLRTEARLQLARLAELSVREVRLAGIQQHCYRMLRGLAQCVPAWSSHDGAAADVVQIYGGYGNTSGHNGHRVQLVNDQAAATSQQNVPAPSGLLSNFHWHAHRILEAKNLSSITAYCVVFEELWEEVRCRFIETCKSLSADDDLRRNTSASPLSDGNTPTTSPGAATASSSHHTAVDSVQVTNSMTGRSKQNPLTSPTSNGSFSAEHTPSSKHANGSLSSQSTAALTSPSPIISPSPGGPILIANPPTELSGPLLQALLYQSDSVSICQTLVLLDSIRRVQERNFVALAEALLSDALGTFSAAQLLHAQHQPPAKFLTGALLRFRTTAELSAAGAGTRSGRRKYLPNNSGVFNTGVVTNLQSSTLSQPGGGSGVMSCAIPGVGMSGSCNNNTSATSLPPRRVKNSITSLGGRASLPGTGGKSGGGTLPLFDAHISPLDLSDDGLGVKNSSLPPVHRGQPRMTPSQKLMAQYGRVKLSDGSGNLVDGTHMLADEYCCGPTNGGGGPGMDAATVTAHYGAYGAGGMPPPNSVVCTQQQPSLGGGPGSGPCRGGYSPNGAGNASALPTDAFELPRDPESFRSQVKGVYYDDTSNRWCASWHERKTGKKRSRYFAVKKFGFSQAKTHAMDARLEAEESGECAPTNIN